MHQKALTSMEETIKIGNVNAYIVEIITPAFAKYIEAISEN
jgi:hypothetical protein